MNTRCGLVASLTMTALSTHATEYHRDVTVTQVLPIAADRPAAQQSANLIRIYVNVADWGTSSCRTDAADLQASDKHLLATLLMGWATGRPIAIAVDDTRRPFDTVCQVAWLALK